MSKINITATAIAALANAIADMIIAFRKIAPEAATPENIDALVAERQAEIDALHDQVNATGP